jgi:uncharacterized membrane protein
VPEKTIIVLGVVVPDESPFFLTVVSLHILFALAAVIVGAGAMLAKKGVGRHATFGTIYFWLMLGVFVTATILSAMRWTHDKHLLVLGVLAFACATFGRFSLRRHGHTRLAVHLSAMGASYVLLLTAFYVDNGRNLPLWKDLPTVAYWTVPALVGVPLIIRALLVHPLVRGARRWT